MAYQIKNGCRNRRKAIIIVLRNINNKSIVYTKLGYHDFILVETIAASTPLVTTGNDVIDNNDAERCKCITVDIMIWR